jgi:subtilase family serine protease
MRTNRVLAGVASASLVMTGLAFAGGVTAGATPATQHTVQLRGSSLPWATPARAQGALATKTQLSVQLWLNSDTEAATAFAASVSTPGSADYRHFLSPDAYTARFGPSASTADTVATWLRGQGFSGVRVDAQRAYVTASAATSTVNRAFRVQEVRYRASTVAHAYDGALFANNRPITLPASIAVDVAGVTGLSDQAAVSTLKTQSAKRTKQFTQSCSRWYGQRIAKYTKAYKGQSRYSTALCGYGAQQLRAAYGASDTATGKGVTVALVELGLVPNMYLTLQDYAKQENMPKPSASRYAELSLGTGNRCGDPFDYEEQLDVESAYDMAPGANLLVVGGDSCGSDYGLGGLFEADEAILDGNGSSPLASIASNSWESGDDSQPVSETTIENTYLLRAVAEGVGMYFSTGDYGGVDEPSANPNVVAVGGTSLGLSKSRSRLFETGWSDGVIFRNGSSWELGGQNGAAGGGASDLWAEPTFQDSVVPTDLTNDGGNKGPSRALPDISADADEQTGFLLGLLTGKRDNVYTNMAIGGTSEASPLVAGAVAAAQQDESSSFGFLDPLLYGLSGTDAFHTTLPVTSTTRPFYRSVDLPTTVPARLKRKYQAISLFDDQASYMETNQVTRPGYDTMTGLGTPNGADFRAALRAGI